MKPVRLLFLLPAFTFACNSINQSVEIPSPSENLEVEIKTNENGELFYSVLGGIGTAHQVVIESSRLGLMREDTDFTEGLELTGISEVKNISDAYTMRSGKFSDLAYEANEQTLTFTNTTGHELQIVFRVFDEGVAFRYVMPGESTDLFRIKKELTSFNVGPGLVSWMSPYQSAKPWGNPGYEADYMPVKSGAPSTEEVGWSFPLLFQKAGQWLYISEAGLDASYCGTHLAHDCKGGIYTIAFPEPDERYGDGEVMPASALPWELPWRFVLVSDSIADIVESSMVYHLAQPSMIEETSWILPGRASWEWWSSKGGRTVKRLNHYIDLAAEMGWEYSLVDAGWENMPDGTIEDVIAYAEQKDVGLLLWYSSGGRRDSTSTSEDFVLFNDDTRKKEMARLEKWGIKGIKVDFFATDKQIAIDLYEKILGDAADHHLLVNFHGCTLPRGWTRTWPNLLTMEAVRGAECYRFSEPYPDIAAFYNSIATILRGTAGPTDFTPATFSDNRYPHITTFGHELALTVVYESGIIHMADNPESYFSLPGEAVDFLKKVPAAWDESRLIEATPGDKFVVARRNGDQWFIAGINGKNEAQEVSFKLPGQMNRAILLADGDTPRELKIENMQGDDGTITVTMKPNGGFVLYPSE